MGIMKVLEKFFRWAKSLFKSLDAQNKALVPAVKEVVDKVKQFIDSPISDWIFDLTAMAIPGTADDKIIGKVHAAAHKYMAKLLLTITIIDTINKIQDPVERAESLTAELAKAIEQLKFADDIAKDAFIRNLARLILEELSDGKVTWIEAANLMEFAFRYPKNVGEK